MSGAEQFSGPSGAGARALTGNPGEGEALEDPANLLASHLLPTLLHGLGNHTQFLTGLRAVLSMEGGGSILHDKADALADVSTRVEDAGWALAVLASAAGSNLLLARREGRGLGILCELVDEALRRAGGARLEKPVRAGEQGWPVLVPDPFAGDQGWQVCWSAASLLLAAGLDQGPQGERLDFEWGDALELPRGPRVEALAPLVRERLPAARLELEAGRARLVLPPGWLAGGAAR